MFVGVLYCCFIVFPLFVEHIVANMININQRLGYLQVRLDVATILGLLAYFFSYKFEDILSSPYVPVRSNCLL